MANRTKYTLGWLTGLCLVAVVAVGCSDDKGADDSNAASDTTGTSVVSKSSTDTKTTTTEDESSDTTIGATRTGDDDPSWQTNATEYRGQDGTQVTVECTPDGVASAVWGTETYTDDSSICTAAVHAGLITFESGGTVTIEITAGAEAYEGTDDNGVSSGNYGAWSGSFVFVGSAS